MPRRSIETAKPGQLYAVEWPEWHVHCAVRGCKETALVAPSGECITVDDAERRAKRDRDNTNLEIGGWKKIKGLWHCEHHAKDQ